MSTRPLLTRAEAAQACSVSMSTIRRRLSAGDFPDARQDGDRVWRIPVDNLLTAGLSLARPAVTPPEHAHDEAVSRVSDQGQDQQTTDEITRLRSLVTDLGQRVAVAEAIAAERGRHLESLTMALRMLNAGVNKVSEHPGDHLDRGANQDGDQAHGRRTGHARPGWLAWLRGDRG